MLTVLYGAIYNEVKPIDPLVLFIYRLISLAPYPLGVILELLQLIGGQSFEEFVLFENFEFLLHLNDLCLLDHHIVLFCVDISHVALSLHENRVGIGIH